MTGNCPMVTYCVVVVSLASTLQVPLRMQVDAISFSAHADFPQTSEFLDRLQVRACCLQGITLHSWSQLCP